MLARLAYGLVLGLLMFIPRPVPRPRVEHVPPDSPPTPDSLPPGVQPPDTLPPSHDDGPHGVPPTPPPGYEGDWPPASARPDLPPTPPPGYEGEWPPVETPPEPPIAVLPFIDDLLFRPEQDEGPFFRHVPFNRFGTNEAILRSDAPIDT